MKVKNNCWRGIKQNIAATKDLSEINLPHKIMDDLHDSSVGSSEYADCLISYFNRVKRDQHAGHYAWICYLQTARKQPVDNTEKLVPSNSGVC